MTTAPALTGKDRQFFEEHGYVVAHGILAGEIETFRDAYIGYLDELAAALDCRAPEGELSDLPFAKRLAVLLGATGGGILGHLDPLLNLSLPNYRWRGDLPPAQTKPLFELMRNEQLLDAVETLIGPEIVASATYHVNMKLPVRALELAADAAARNGRSIPAHSLWKFMAGGATPWHSDGHHALPGADRITAWIPLTEATLDGGCLKIVPGSHKLGVDSQTLSDPESAVALPTRPGDVIFFDHWTLHGAEANRANDHLRWAFNFRYHRAGVPSDTVHLPSFMARSRANRATELSDPALWTNMWRSSLGYLQDHIVPSRPNERISREDADILRRIWPVRLSNHEDWLRLGESDFPDPETAAEIERILKITRPRDRRAAG
jgi:phytanoyl-CoA hydroxylase